MKIAIIGWGSVGKALAKSSIRAGHSVTISSRMADPVVDGIRLGGFVAGDNQAAKDCRSDTAGPGRTVGS